MAPRDLSRFLGNQRSKASAENYIPSIDSILRPDPVRVRAALTLAKRFNLSVTPMSPKERAAVLYETRSLGEALVVEGLLPFEALEGEGPFAWDRDSGVEMDARPGDAAELVSLAASLPGVRAAAGIWPHLFEAARQWGFDCGGGVRRRKPSFVVPGAGDIAPTRARQGA